MSLFSRLGQAMRRSLAQVQNNTERIMRMEVSASESHAAIQLLYKLETPADIKQIALGSDSDIGGLSRCHIALEHSNEGESPASYARFYGTLSSQIPRGSALERSGYAAFRNKTRPTLFSVQTWDTTYHPYLAILVRNRMARRAKGSNTDSSSSSSSSLRSALHANDPAGPAIPRAVEALGLACGHVPARSSTSPLFFVNVQTDGPVTTDLYQHRLFLDDAHGQDWQTITIPFDSFVLTNTGVVSEAQVSMMREKILTVGISALLEPPLLPDGSEGEGAAPGSLSALRAPNSSGTAQPGSKRDRTVQFDLDVAGVWAVSSPTDAAGLL